MGCAARTGLPILLVHQPDGMGVNMWATHSCEAPSRARGVARSGRHRAEFLLGLQILKTIDERGRHLQCIHFYSPRELVGKTGWHVWSSSLDCPSLVHAASVASNIRVQVYIQDGLHASGMTSKHAAYAQLYYEGVETPPAVTTWLACCIPISIGLLA